MVEYLLSRMFENSVTMYSAGLVAIDLVVACGAGYFGYLLYEHPGKEDDVAKYLGIGLMTFGALNLIVTAL